MTLKNPRSIIIILFYAAINGFIILASVRKHAEEKSISTPQVSFAPEFTQIEELDYFHLKNGVPQMSLNASRMKSQGEELAEFENPKGVYNYQQKKKTLLYQAEKGSYEKAKDLLILEANVRIVADEAEYLASRIKYYFKKDLVLGTGGVAFNGVDLKSQDKLEIKSESMRANPQSQFSRFKGNVQGNIQRKKKYEGKMTFSSQQLQFEGLKSLAHLEGDVRLSRQSYLITAGKADIYLENFNKSLKYFVFNDDVKVTEKLQTPEGLSYRKAFAERLEGFGKEQKMILSGAPKVEMGSDVVKGYRITIRENLDLIEVDDAMSDVQVKKEKNKKLKE